MLFVCFPMPTAHVFYFSSIVSPGEHPLTEEPRALQDRAFSFREGARNVKRKVTNNKSRIKPRTSSFRNPFSCESKLISFLSAAMFLSIRNKQSKTTRLTRLITNRKAGAVTMDLKAGTVSLSVWLLF